MAFYETAFHRYVRPHIDKHVPADAHGWQLYSTENGAEVAAGELSEHLRTLLTDIGQSFTTGMAAMDRCRDKYCKLGACDTEPRVVVQDAVESLLAYLAREMF